MDLHETERRKNALITLLEARGCTVNYTADKSLSPCKLSNLCRSCMKDLTQKENNVNPNTMKRFTYCTNIDVLNAEDQLPQKFCSQCTTAIESCYTFISTARDVDAKLKDILITYKDIELEIADHTKSGLCDRVIKMNSNNDASDNDTLDNNEVQSNNDSQYGLSDLDTKINSDNDAIETNNDTALDSINIKKKTESDDEKIRKETCKVPKEQSMQYERRVSKISKMNIKSLEMKSTELSKQNARLQWSLKKYMLARDSNNESKQTATSTPNENSQTMINNNVTQVGDDQTLGTRSGGFTCTLCNKSYAYNNDLERHMLLFHSKVTPISCKMCDKSFVSDSKLLAHSNLAHSKFPCKLCSKVFYSKYNLCRHNDLEHKKCLRYNCPTCPLTFDIYSLFTAHMKAHPANPFRYSCDYCKKMFKFKSDLRKHLYVHDITLKLVLCDICGSRYSNKRALRDHRRVHTGEKPFTCEECGYTCAFEMNLKKHMARHKSERKYQCAQCGKAFVDSYSLNIHMICHTDERPYKCPHCEKRYRKSTSRKKHMIRYHGIDRADIPRMSKEGGPARRYVTSDVRTKLDYTVVAQRPKKSATVDQKYDSPNT